MSHESFSRNLRSEPSVSVVLPTRNRPQLLREALASVSAQRGAHFEVIVVNDGGCDVSDVLDDFRSELDLRYVSFFINAGAPAARNAGIKEARAPYVAYLDDDDLYLPNHLARLVARLESDQEIGLVYSDALLLLQRYVGDSYRTVARRVLAQDYDRAVMMHDSFIAPSGMMHRRECIERVGGFDEEMRWCYEDWDFLLKVDACYRIERVAGVSVAVRLRESGNNMSSTVKPERTYAARILQERYGVGEIQPKTFWEVAETLSQKGDTNGGGMSESVDS